MQEDKYARFGRAIKRASIDIYLQRYHIILSTLAAGALAGFLYTGIAGLIYLYAPVEDAYYAQHYTEFRSSVNAKNYFKQFLPRPVWDVLSQMPANSNWDLIEKSKIEKGQTSSWPAEQKISQILFNNQLKIGREEYEAWEEYLRNKLIWNRNYDGQANPYLSEDLQKKYDFRKMVDRLYTQFSEEIIASTEYLEKKADKSLPLNTVVYKRFTSAKVGLPSTWFYKTLSKSMKDLEIVLEKQNEQKALRYTKAYHYLLGAGFFLGFVICYLLYYLRHHLEQKKRRRVGDTTV